MGLFEKAMKAFTPKAPESTDLFLNPPYGLDKLVERKAELDRTLKMMEEAKRMATIYTTNFKKELETLCAHTVPKSSGYKWDVNYDISSNMYEVHIAHTCGLEVGDLFSEAAGVYSAERQLRALATNLVDRVVMATPSYTVGPSVPYVTGVSSWGAVTAAPTMALTNEEITRIRRMLAAFEGAVKEKESDGSS